MGEILKSHWSFLFPGLKRFEREFAEICDQLDQMNTSVKRIEEKIDSEPIPPNPETAPPEEIEAYKEAVREAGNMPPQKNCDPNGI